VCVCVLIDLYSFTILVITFLPSNCREVSSFKTLMFM
jgi:hypothetical protein